MLKCIFLSTCFDPGDSGHEHWTVPGGLLLDNEHRVNIAHCMIYKRIIPLVHKTRKLCSDWGLGWCKTCCGGQGVPPSLGTCLCLRRSRWAAARSGCWGCGPRPWSSSPGSWWSGSPPWRDRGGRPRPPRTHWNKEQTAPEAQRTVSGCLVSTEENTEEGTWQTSPSGTCTGFWRRPARTAAQASWCPRGGSRPQPRARRCSWCSTPPLQETSKK